MKRVVRLIVLLVTGLVGVVTASPASAAPLPSTGVSLLWFSDPDPSVVGHRAALNISVSSAPDTYGTFYVYEGTTVPSSGTALATLVVNGSAQSVMFTTATNVGAATRFSVKFVSSNASYSNTNFENIRLTCSAGTYSTSGFGPCLNAPAGHYVAYQGSTEICHVRQELFKQMKVKCFACLHLPEPSYPDTVRLLQPCVPSVHSHLTLDHCFVNLRQ